MKNPDDLIARQNARLAAREPKLPEKLSNLDRLHHMMNFSEHGAMAQLFIMEAIRYYSEINMQVEIDENEVDNRIIPKRLWRDVAIDINRQINEHLGIKKD
jgi:hypothetical protein